MFTNLGHNVILDSKKNTVLLSRREVVAHKHAISKSKALLTAIGFMVGSGIFFRADNIIGATGGNVVISILAWLVTASALIFAGIAIAGVASQENIEGGFVGYIGHYFSKWFGEKIGRTLEFIIGWYQIVVYAPILGGVVSIVFAGYFCQLFGIDGSTTVIHGIAVALLVAMFMWNKVSTKIAATISATSTSIKVIPLIVIAVAGISFGNPGELSAHVLPNMFEKEPTMLALLFAPMLSMAFAFDGWISVGALSEDIVNPKKNLPFIFVWSVVITSVIYIAYFIGVNALMSPADILKYGDSHVGMIARNLFGDMGEKLVLTGVLISVLGTANAIFMAGTRYVHKLACDGHLIGSDKLKQFSKTDTPFNASKFIFAGTLAYIGLYALQATGNVEMLKGIAIDDIPMMLNAAFYLLVFFISFKLFIEKKVNGFQGLVAPIIAATGQIFVIVAFFLSNDKAVLYIMVSAVVIALGFVNKMKFSK